MKSWRLVIAIVVIAALVALSVRTTATSESAAPSIPCTTSALGVGFSTQMHLTSFQNFGCEGEWAYAWATIGAGQHAIGVTEVLSYSVTKGRWSIVSRLTYCKASILPSVIYRQGCFSN
jgi:hypothetical protein